MKSFLTYVAQDIIQKYGNNLSDIAIVFPNKRASLFLNEQLARLVSHPLWSPTYITISDLFRQHTTLKVGDPIKLVCDLHKSFVECTGIEETLDHFYGWGQLLIADFDDVDKNMASAKQLFANLSDIHELDDVSYLTEEQKEIIKKFFSNFSDDHNTELKKRFLQLWSHFYDIYTNFNQRLEAQNLAYEGALYRRVVEDESLEFRHKKYLFVGFNMMQCVEQKLCSRLQKEGKAAFYWDFDKYYMKDGNEAGYYIRQLKSSFGNELDYLSETELYDSFDSTKDITYISAPTDNIQARYIHSWLMQDERYKQGRSTAIVLADESLLPTVIHSLPEEVESVNITLGYPLQQTPFYSLIQTLTNLQTLGYDKDRDCYRLRYVNYVLRHPYAQYISSAYAELMGELHDKKIFFPSRKWLCQKEDEGLEILFQEMSSGENFNLSLVQYLLDVLKNIGTQARTLDDPLFQESLFRTYTLVNRLHELIQSGDLIVDIITLQHLLLQLMQTTTIPFHGEPAEGIQIMGVLETRNLDFDHIIVLSASEGNLPKGVNDSSFIPYSLRKAYGLTTVDNKVAIFSYYFHRMLQRSADITLTYNNSTEDGHTGEMSRFMLQLLVESKHQVKTAALSSGQVPLPPDQMKIEKTDEMISLLIDGNIISPTSLN
uniref:PD-(D/E)XK nuclease family protein n=1 Tax=Prevotella sp. TaxID=59823 RepID=UPI00402A27F5